MADITVLGAGGWGIAIAVLLNNNGHIDNITEKVFNFSE